MSSALRFLFVLLPGLLLGCGGASTATNSSPTVDVTPVFSTADYTVYSIKPEWSPGGGQIAFEGQAIGTGAWDIFVVDSGGTLTKITNWSNSHWENGGITPASTSTSTLVYWVGDMASDGLHHLMAAASGQVANSPAPSVLHTFSPAAVSRVGVDSPAAMSITGDGAKAVLCWNTAFWLLDWSVGATPAATQITGVTECVISREGTYLAYAKTNGDVAYRSLSGGSETVIGQGSAVSWASGGRVGFAVSGGYRVYNTATATATTYASGLYLQNAVISWDASKIAFRTFGGANTGISVGTLVAN